MSAGTSLDELADPVEHLTTGLVRTLRELGNAGRPRLANQIAADIYVAIRLDEPRVAQRINGVMHYLVRLERSHSKGALPVTNATQLDVRSLPPAQRHAEIFETFDALVPGTAFELVNDHDPKPLYYQLAAEHPGEFTWDYLEQGPEVWRVRIGRAGAEAASA